MNRIFTFPGIFAISLLIFVAGYSIADDRMTVRWVSDGDTIVLENDEKIRYVGINTPEIPHPDKPGQALGEDAKAFNKNLVFQKKVRLEYDNRTQDQYGRTLAYVFSEDGTMVNARLIEEGYAHVLPCESGCKYDSLLLKKQQSAMNARKGMWKNWQESSSDYVGNSRSKRFHTLSCPFGQKTGRNNRVSFSKRWDAFYEGFAPCKKCNP